MKFIEKLSKCFKNKRFVSWFAVCVAVIVAGTSALGIMLPSYYQWKEYHDAAIADREYKKYLQSLPLECTGITAELNDSVTYYANGKASPKSDDFTVIGHFTEKGEAFDTVLGSEDFAVTFADNFAEIGGDITVSYTFTPEPPEPEEGEETETPKPVEFTASVAYTLEKVVPVSIVRNCAPYRVFYGDDMSFDGDGLGATVTFNDGTTETVYNDEFVYGDEKLAAGVDSVRVTWSRGGTELAFDCPIRVVPKAQYSDGRILSIAPADTIYVDPGAQISSVKPAIRATYESGNRLIINENMYTVRGNLPYASLTQKCLITVSLSSDPSIFTRTPAVVKSGMKAAEATVALADIEDVHESVSVDGEYVTSDEATTVVAPRRNSSISFNIRSAAVSKPDMSLRIALKPIVDRTPAEDAEIEAQATASVGVNISDMIIMSVNGRSVKLPAGLKLMQAAGEEDKYVFYDIVLPAPILQGRINSVRFIFRGDDADKIVVDRINLESTYKGTFYTSTESYLMDLSESESKTAEFVSSAFKGWGYIGSNPAHRAFYPHGICSDGRYLYVLATSNVGASRNGSVTKYDLSSGSVAATTARFGDAQLSEQTSGICYYDNKIIASLADGSHVYIDADDFNADGVVMSEYHGFDKIKEQIGSNEKITDVYFNTVKLKFAVLTDAGRIYLFDESMELYKSFGLTGSSTFYRMTGSADRIYVNYCKRGGNQPNLAVYDWAENSAYENNYIGMRTVAVAEADYSAAGINDFVNVNTHGIAFINGDIYISIVKMGTANGGAGGDIWKMTMPEISNELLPELTYSEYIDECANNNVKPNFTVSPTATGVDAIGTVSGTAGYGRGGVSDGRYLYIANGRSVNKGFAVTKVDPETYAPVCASVTTLVSSDVNAGDNSRLFIKDGVLYVVAGDVYSIRLADFRANCVIEKDNEMTNLLSLGGSIVVKSAYWNETWRRYVVCDNGTNYNGGDVYILDEYGTVIKMFATLRSGRKVSAVTGDDGYFYILYNANNVSLEFDVFRYDGSRAFALNVPGVSLGNGVNFNLQAMYLHNGQMHLSVCSWDGGYQNFHDWTLYCDTSIFNVKLPFDQSLSSCLDKGITPMFYGMPSVGDNGLLPGSREAYSKGGAYDGQYLYVATGIGNMTIERVDLTTYSVVATSKIFAVGGDKGRLFIKDGVLYCVGGDVFSIALSDYADNCTLTKNDEMKALLSQNDAYNAISAYYNSEAQKYAVLDGGGVVHLLDSDGAEITSSDSNYGSSYVASSVCGDDSFYYVSYRKNFQNIIPIDVYRWDGTYVTTVEVTGISGGADAGASYNVQAIYMVDGKLHAGISTWGNSTRGFKDWTIEFDTAASC